MAQAITVPPAVPVGGTWTVTLKDATDLTTLAGPLAYTATTNDTGATVAVHLAAALNSIAGFTATAADGTVTLTSTHGVAFTVVLQQPDQVTQGTSPMTRR